MPLYSVINTCTVYWIFAIIWLSLIMWKGVDPELTAVSPTRFELMKFYCSRLSCEDECISVSEDLATLI
jgi:hypothetical protein